MGILDLAERRAALGESAAASWIRDEEIDWSRYELPEDDRARVRDASTWTDQLIEHFLLPPERSGATLPWPSTHAQFRFRPGELTIWSGINGHRKSMVTSQIMLDLIAQGERVCMASLEMQPVQTLARMARQAVGTDDPSVEYLRRFCGLVSGKLWIYDQIGTVATRRMLALSRYAREEKRVDHVVIDSLMKCGMATDDYNAQKRFVDGLATYCRDSGVHVHLVAHSRKGQDEATPGKMDVSGTADLTNMVDNVWIVWANKRKAQAELEGSDKYADQPDQLLICEKQRAGEWQGRIALWWHAKSLQLLSRSGGAPRHYLDGVRR